MEEAEALVGQFLDGYDIDYLASAPGMSTLITCLIYLNI